MAVFKHFAEESILKTLTIIRTLQLCDWHSTFMYTELV